MVELNAMPAVRALFPLDGYYHSGAGVAMTPLATRTMIALQLSDAAIDPVGRALDIALPTRPKTSVEANGLAALWLGPGDLMLVSQAVEEAAAVIGRIEASGTAEQSAVEVSDQFVAIRIEGAAAAAIVNGGCPQDLRLPAFPVGAVSRTVFARAEIILWRRAETSFELICRRSFADYVWSYLVEASRAPTH